jgi:hypothetical protein
MPRDYTGDGLNNRRDARGSKRSCFETLSIGGVLVASLVALLKGGKK